MEQTHVVDEELVTCPACEVHRKAVKPASIHHPDILICYECWFALHLSRCYAASARENISFEDLADEVLKESGLSLSAVPTARRKSVSSMILSNRSQSETAVNSRESDQLLIEIIRKKFRKAGLTVQRGIKDYNSFDLKL